MPKQRRMRLTYSASELLLLFPEEEMEFLEATFKELDIRLEAHHWAAWWEDRDGVLNPRASFINWLKKAEAIRQAAIQRSNHKELTSDVAEYRRRYPLEEA